MQHIKRPTEQPHQAKPGAPAAPAPEDDDPVPENIDEFRKRLIPLSQALTISRGSGRWLNHAMLRDRNVVAPDQPLEA